MSTNMRDLVTGNTVQTDAGTLGMLTEGKARELIKARISESEWWIFLLADMGAIKTIIRIERAFYRGKHSADIETVLNPTNRLPIFFCHTRRMSAEALARLSSGGVSDPAMIARLNDNRLICIGADAGLSARVLSIFQSWLDDRWTGFRSN